MDENFTKFNSSILNQIYDFINSTDDLLYISGFQGCGKSEIVNKAINEIYDDEILLFRHLCFENSVIDDFLLGFYDTLRYYSINKKINLKKTLTENFAQKVSFYFKNLDKKSLIVIDNFEIIAENSEIMDFLSHLGKYENVKLILVSRILNPDFFEKKGLKSKVINILSNDYETFKMKAADTLELCEEADIEELFKQTQGYELYLKMSLRYIQTVNTTLKEFIEEFKKRNLEFDDFLLSKIVSLVPPIYLPFLQNMSCLNHSVKISFIEHYGLGDISLVNYLHRKMLISKFDDEIYLKDYLKQYFLNSLSVKEKIAAYKKLIEIYNKELSKSPRDRLLRLSRESIRKQIEFIKGKIPNINEAKTIKSTGFSYIGQAAAGAKPNEPWYMKLALEGGKKFQKKEPALQENAAALPNTELEALSEEEKKLISDFRKNKTQNTATASVKNTEPDFMMQAEKAEKEYSYKDAIEYLNEGLKEILDEEKKAKVYLKLAKNYIKTNDFNGALDSYNKAADICKKTGNEVGFVDVRLLQAGLYKNLYRFNQAVNYLQDIVNTENCAANTAAKAFLELGEIYETENNFKQALENYLKALDTIDKEQSENILEAEIYFKIALLYDDGQNPKLALKYYKKAVETGENAPQDKHKGFISTSLANSGLIYAELWAENGSTEAFERCVENFKAALEIDKKEENNSGIYFASKQLADVLRNSNPEESVEYLLSALEAAKKLEDDFKTALSYLEIGDYYYNLQDNKKALQNYLEARNVLGENISDENKERISVRINDMKIKMDKAEFEGVLAGYEQ